MADPRTPPPPSAAPRKDPPASAQAAPVVMRNVFDEPPKRKIDPKALTVALGTTTVLFVVIFYSVLTAKFELKLHNYADEKLDTELIKPPPPIEIRSGSRSGTSSRISSPSVPCPAIVAGASNG